MKDGESVPETHLKIIIIFAIALDKLASLEALKLKTFHLNEKNLNVDCCKRHELTNSVQENLTDNNSIIQPCAIGRSKIQIQDYSIIIYFFQLHKPLETNSPS